MKFWSKSEFAEWLRSINIPNQDGRVIVDESWVVNRIDLPTQSSAQAEISRSLVGSITPFNGCVLCLTEWGVFPDEHNPVLFKRVRLSYGESRSFAEAPAFWIEASEKEEAIAVIRLLIMFSWDAYLVSLSGDFVAIVIGHEDFAELCTRGGGK